MEEKRTFGEFVKANRGKIIKGTIIVVGVVAGIIIVRKLTGRGGEEIIDGIQELPDGLNMDGFDIIGDITGK